MILSTTVPVTYSNNKKYYISKGYPAEKQGFVVEVKIEDLPISSNKKIICSCDSCSSIFKRSYQLLIKQRNKQNNEDFCYKCARKRVGDIMNKQNIIKATRLRTGEKHPRWNFNKKEFKKYERSVRYYTEKQPLFLLENSDKPRKKCGVSGGYQLDHILSIKEGFVRGIEPKFVGSLVNLQFIPWEINRSKSSKSDVDLQINTFIVDLK